MNHVRSLTLGLAGLACLALLLPRTAIAYAQPDLQGPWQFNSIASGPGAPWWERARAVVAAGGNFTAFTSMNDGSVDTIQGAMALSSAGFVTIAGLTTFRGALDIGGTVFAATDTWSSGSPGTTELKVGVKTVGGYRLTDLAGAWEFNMIASGAGAPWWERGRLTVTADGSISGTLTDNMGQLDPVSGSFGILPDGTITLSGSSTGRGVLDVGKTVLVMTSTWAGGMPGTVDLSVGVKMASAYTLADLVGTWEFNGLATGPGAPCWIRSEFTVAPDGSYTGSSSTSDGGSGWSSGTVSISPTGVVTRSGSSPARGVLDAGKSVLVWTDIWSTRSPGTTQLDVAVRTSGSTAGVVGDTGLLFALEPMRPNPATGSAVTVRFSLPDAARAQIELLDVAGRRIAGREVGALGAGRHTLDLAEGARLAPGLYLVRLRQGTSERVGRVVVL